MSEVGREYDSADVVTLRVHAPADGAETVTAIPRAGRRSDGYRGGPWAAQALASCGLRDQGSKDSSHHAAPAEW